VSIYLDGDPGRVPVPPRDGLRRAKPGYVHAIHGSYSDTILSGYWARRARVALRVSTTS